MNAGFQIRESVKNRIHRLKRGIPAVGKLPFGRTYDRKALRWGIHPAKQKMMRDVAKRYLADESMESIAAEYGVDQANLHWLLLKRCGTNWSVRFKSKRFNIDETIELTVPALLDDATIKAVHLKKNQNKTRTSKGGTEHKYLLRGMVFCAKCGYSLQGQPRTARGTFVYRHSSNQNAKKCDVRPRPWIREHALDDAVIRQLLDWYGNPPAVKKAIEAAHPNLKRLDCLNDDLEQNRKSIAKLKKALTKLESKAIDELIYKGTISEESLTQKKEPLQKRLTVLRARRNRLVAEIEAMPTPQTIKTEAVRVASAMKKRIGKKKNPKRSRRRTSALATAAIGLADSFEHLTWADKRALLEDVFNGTLVDGRPMGVYVLPIDGQVDGRYKQWRFVLRGSTGLPRIGANGRTSGDTADLQCVAELASS
ncbi:MAG TPA: zinc ribbon domain-containing protein [Pirellulales bacterium]